MPKATKSGKSPEESDSSLLELELLSLSDASPEVGSELLFEFDEESSIGAVSSTPLAATSTCPSGGALTEQRNSANGCLIF
jgi:hypothetical protein